jgi:hypothetical protein
MHPLSQFRVCPSLWAASSYRRHLRPVLLAVALLWSRTLLAIHLGTQHLVVHPLYLRNRNIGTWPVVMNRVVPVAHR